MLLQIAAVRVPELRRPFFGWIRPLSPSQTLDEIVTRLDTMTESVRHDTADGVNENRDADGGVRTKEFLDGATGCGYDRAVLVWARLELLMSRERFALQNTAVQLTPDTLT